MNILQAPEFIDAHEETLDSRWTLEHVNKHTELIYVLEGRFCLEYKDVSVPAARGDMIFINQQTAHRDKFRFDHNPKLFYINLQWADSDKFFAKTSHHLSSGLRPQTLFAVKQLFTDIRNDCEVGKIDLDITNCRLHLLLLLIYRDYLQQDNHFLLEQDKLKLKHINIVNRLKNYINSNFRTAPSLDDLSRAINVSPFYLSRIFSNITGSSISGYLNDVRMNQACKLIKAKKYTNDEIADVIGLSSGHYFAKVFKKKFGCTPSEYKG